MAITADKAGVNTLLAHPSGGYVLDMPVVVGETIFKGGFVEVDSTGGIQDADTDGGTGSFPGGIALEGATGAGSLGDVTAKVLVGACIEYPVAGSAIDDIGEIVYASDNSTLTVTSTTNQFMGHIIGFVSGTTCIVKMAHPGTVAEDTDT